jgi:hypothetical protein
VRVTLLPRDVAARVITGSFSTLAWVCGAAIVLIAVVVLVETLVRRGISEAIPVPLAMLAVILIGILVALRWMRPAVVAAYLVVATAASIVYAASLLQADPSLAEDAVFVLNRPTLALGTIGVATSSAVVALGWLSAGFVAASVVPLAAGWIAGVPMSWGIGPLMVLAVGFVTYLTLFAIQARHRDKVPGYDVLEAAALRRAASADLAQRTTALVHDTVLNDLTILMNAPDELGAAARARLLDDLDTLEGGAWLRASESVSTPGEQQSQLLNELDRLTSDFRWRGLTVNVSGTRDGVFACAPEAADALLGALRASLENVLAHSGAEAADIEAIAGDGELVFLVTDQGAGFDPAEIASARLGVRGSIVARMESAGGRAQLWSTPGAGTTVLLAVPVSADRSPAGEAAP